jgi:hypothetical protein
VAQRILISQTKTLHLSNRIHSFPLSYPRNGGAGDGDGRVGLRFHSPDVAETSRTRVEMIFFLKTLNKELFSCVGIKIKTKKKTII